MNILAIDPGTTQSGWVLIDNKELCPLGNVGIWDNERMLNINMQNYGYVVIERVGSYGMRVGQEVFDTAWWAGRFFQAAKEKNDCHMIFRRDVKLHICGRANAKDADIKQALIDRFAYGQKNSGKGTKTAPGWFHGFHDDIWQAYALAVTFADAMK